MHREIEPGVMANVVANASPETLAALKEAARLAARTKKLCTTCSALFYPDEPHHNTCADCAKYQAWSEY